MPLIRSNVTYRKGLRGPGWGTSAYYGLKGDNSFNNSSAWATAMADLAVDSGTLYVSGGTFKFNAGLTVPKGVSISGKPFGTILNLNHATDAFLTLSDTATDHVNDAFIENLIFGSAVSNSGICISNTAGLYKMHLRNLGWNDPAGGIDNLNGRFFTTVVASDVMISKCRLWQHGTSSGVFNQNHASSYLQVNDNYIHQMPTSNTSLLSNVAGKIHISRNRFDSIDHSLSADVININGASNLAIIEGNWFESSFSSGAALVWTAGAKITEQGNDFTLINMYSSGGLLTSGSRLGLGRPLHVTTSSASITVSAGFEAYSVSSTGTAPTVTLPAIFFPGQELVFTIYNNSGSTWAGVGFTGGSPSAGIGSTPTGQARTCRFKAVSILANGSYAWQMIGDFSTSYVP